MDFLISLPKKTLISAVAPALLFCLFQVGAAYASPAPQVTPLSLVTEGVSSPIRVAIDPQGNIYLADPRGGGLLKYDGSGKLLQVVKTAKSPQGVALAPDGNLVVTQGDYAAILDKTGAEISRLGVGAGQFKMANGVTTDSAGLIYVVDSLDNCVQVFNANGTPVVMASAASGKPANSFGTAGNLPGQFSVPAGITYEKSTNQLAVADTLNGRVQFFTLQGVYVKSLGSYGAGPLQFSSPQAVAFEYTKDPVPAVKRIYVVDVFQSNLQAIDPQGGGAFLGFVGTYGGGNGQLMAPSDAVFDQSGSRLIVANGYGNLTVYGIGDAAGTTPGATLPTLTINPVPTSTNVPNITIGGSVSAGATVTVAGDVAAIGGNATVTGTTWSYNISGLVPGVNVITVTATDAAGNATKQTASVTFDVGAPALAINPVTALTNSSSQTISGTMDKGTTVSVTANTGATAGTVVYPTDTSWKCDITGLVSGDNKITVTASKIGGGSMSENVVITLDTTPPAVTVSALADGETTSLQMQNVMGVVADDHFGQVTVNGQTAAVTNGTFSVPVVLDNGANTITVVATDLAGNVTTDKRTVTFDATTPSITVSAPVDGSVTNSGTLTVSGTSGANITVTVGGVPAQMNGGNWSASVNLAPGTNTIEIKAADLSGAASIVKRTVTSKSVGPEVAVTVPGQDLATNQANLSLSGTATGGSTVTASVNGVDRPVTLSNGAYGFTMDLPAEGVYMVAVKATDSAGNTSTASRNVVYDTTPPRLTMNPVTGPVPARVGGTVEPDAVMSAADKNGAVGTITAANGTWSLDLTGASYDPATLIVTATDAAGNRSTKSVTSAPNAPDGDLNGDGKVDVVDALMALQISAGLVPQTSNDLLHGDVAPLVDGKPSPDGVIDVGDALVILRKAVGQINW